MSVPRRFKCAVFASFQGQSVSTHTSMDIKDPSHSSQRQHRHQHFRHGHQHSQGHHHARDEYFAEPSDGPHPKRRRRSHHENDIAQGNLNRAIDQRTGNDLVESWLEQTGDPGRRKPLSRLKEQEQPPTIGRSRPRLQRYEVSPLLSLGPSRIRRRARRGLASHNSSLLSGFENDKAIVQNLSPPPRREFPDDDTPSPEQQRKFEANHLDDLSIELSSSGAYRFEKRPRHKTREDKYDKIQKKHKRERSKDRGRHHRKKRNGKYEKRRALTSSKNVISNFNSDAVMNDRITVRLAAVLALVPVADHQYR
ncbi:uncharacterized protein BCR38DRAFT_429017 [Pseudomassariella vexata]|uniref:Uncharacterized protein n=1 Tax=Pseudomassariella vexata TaxID=1141098 RepID=A0A1Y2E576_9PEZI|nr:uncharacterized protein BCR38DRAFT_429017 [Pseudomassariella vexata]ORY66015.1 hypothetical protein BCR38DRAFT_429017 [Pseudomassariella vexata]